MRHVLRPNYGNLALRLSWRVSLLILITLFLTALIGFRLPLWVVLGISIIVGAGTFLFIRWIVARRIARLQTKLAKIGEDDATPFTNASAPLRDELDGLNELAIEANQRILYQKQERERVEHYRREFLGNVSHELKTPIFAIQGFAETLLDGALEDQRVRRAFVKKVLRNATRLGNLAEDLASVARIEMGELSMVLKPFNLNELIEEVSESLESLAVDRNVTIRSAVPSGLPPVIADRSRISQVLSNLIDNGIKYGRDGGLVEIIARPLPDGSVKISVVDDGIGIALEHIPRLTERFFRVEPSRSSKLGGTGLGLAIVKHILGAHNSQLMIESLLGSGSTFGFTLPTADASTGSFQN